MNYPVELLEKIDQFLDGQLPDHECRDIERRMLDDTNFREVVHAMQQSKIYIEEAELISMARQVVKRLDQEEAVKLSVPTRRIGQNNWARTIGIAAFFLLANGLFLTFSSAELANADISPQVHREALETAPETLRPLEKQALNNFILANDLFVNGNYEAAIPFYKRTADAPVSDYLKECTWWNLSLAYLRLGNIGEAKRYYQQYNAIKKPHFQSGYFSQMRLKVQLIWADLFA